MRGAASGQIALVALATAFSGAPAFAQPYGQTPYPNQNRVYPHPYASPSAPSHPQTGSGYGAQPYCCVLPEGTAAAVQLVDAVSTSNAKAGDSFAIRLAAPVIVDGQVVLPAGTPGSGHVVQASGPGLGGKGAKLVVSADYLTVGGGEVPLGGLQLTGTGKDHTTAADLASLGGWISLPLSFVGFAVTGGGIEIPAGTNAAAKVAQTVNLYPLRQATQQDYDTLQAVFGQPQQSRGWIDVPPPPTVR